MLQTQGRAQLSSEFLHIIAIVLLLSLVAAAIAASAFPQDIEAQISESKIYWSANAQPLKITDWVLKVAEQDEPISVVQYNLTMVIYNPGNEMMLLKRIDISPGDYGDIYYSDGTWAGHNNEIAVHAYPHQSVTLTAERWEINGTAPQQSMYALNVVMGISTELADSEQIGRIPLIGRPGRGIEGAGSLGYCQKAYFTCPAGENGGGACCERGYYCFYGACIRDCGPGESEFICDRSCCHIDHNCDLSYCVAACPDERKRNCVNQVGKWCCEQRQRCGENIGECEG